MGRFDFSPTALDEGLTTNDVFEFAETCAVFESKANRARQAGASAETVADAYTAWLKVGAELLEIFSKAVASKAAKTEVPSTRRRFADTFRSFLDRFTSGKDV